jgi:hypothetical protein
MTPMHLTLNPAEIITGWTALVAVLSLVNKYIIGAAFPNAARFISALISLPIGHLANVIEDIQQLVSDVTPPPAPPGPTPPAVVVAPPAPPADPPPAAARIGLAFAVAIAVAGLVLFGAQTGCTPAQSAEMVNVETTILGDLAANKSQAQIEQDVARIIGNGVIPGGGNIGVDVVIVLDDALVLLIDSGTLTPAELTAAQTLLGQVHPTAVGHRALRDAK